MATLRDGMNEDDDDTEVITKEYPLLPVPTREEKDQHCPELTYFAQRWELKSQIYRRYRDAHQLIKAARRWGAPKERDVQDAALAGIKTCRKNITQTRVALNVLKAMYVAKYDDSEE